MKLFTALATTLLFLAAPAAIAHDTGTTTMFARLAYLDQDGNRVAVTVAFLSATGQAVVTYDFGGASTLRDEMSGCTLTTANSTFGLVCTNPHFTTWDALRRTYTVYSERASFGELTTYDLVGPVEVSMRFEPDSAE